ncbi:hypothetical protein BH11PAT4_BH11PAT4_4690 [soil metagenome]
MQKILILTFALAVVLGSSPPARGQQTNASSGYSVYEKFLTPVWAKSDLLIRRGSAGATYEKARFKVSKYFDTSLEFSKLLRKPRNHTVKDLTLLIREDKKTKLVTFELYTKTGKLFAKIVPNAKKQYRFKQYGKSWRINLSLSKIGVNASQPADSYTGSWNFSADPKY